jgi:hypothetical protein
MLGDITGHATRITIKRQNFFVFVRYRIGSTLPLPSPPLANIATGLSSFVFHRGGGREQFKRRQQKRRLLVLREIRMPSSSASTPVGTSASSTATSPTSVSSTGRSSSLFLVVQYLPTTIEHVNNEEDGFPHVKWTELEFLKSLWGLGTEEE